MLCINTTYIATSVPVESVKETEILKGDIIEAEIAEDVTNPGHFFFKSTRTGLCYPMVDFTMHIPKRHTSFQEQLLKIIRHDLGRNDLFRMVNGDLISAGNRSLCCAQRIAVELHMYNDMEMIIDLARFIENSWDDLELSESQEAAIVNKVEDIVKNRVNA